MRVGILGAGSIGAYVGGRLVAAGVPVTMVGRAALAEAVAATGLRLTDLAGFDVTLPPDRVPVATEARVLADCDVILVTVKALDTRTAGEKLAAIARPDALVVSLQNGVHNREVLAAALGGQQTVAPGMVNFNVLRRGPAHLHQGTSGRLVVAALPDGREQAIVTALTAAGLPTVARGDIERVLWGKLLVNLNNSINALSGIPLLLQLRQRGYRRAMAACVREGLTVLRAAAIKPWLDAPLPPAWLPSLLELPDWLFTRVARPFLAVDPNARSSMWEDLQRGRATEIDLLNGEIVKLGARVNVKTPYNSRVIEMIKIAEKGAPPSLSPEQLQQDLFSNAS
jgi:2-dehydropantoate 2-reductase